MIDTAKKTNDPNLFYLNREYQKQKRLGKNLLQVYNAEVSKLNTERAVMLATAKKQEDKALREIYDQTISYATQPGGKIEDESIVETLPEVHNLETKGGPSETF